MDIRLGGKRYRLGPMRYGIQETSFSDECKGIPADRSGNMHWPLQFTRLLLTENRSSGMEFDRDSNLGEIEVNFCGTQKLRFVQETCVRTARMIHGITFGMCISWPSKMEVHIMLSPLEH